MLNTFTSKSKILVLFLPGSGLKPDHGQTPDFRPSTIIDPNNLMANPHRCDNHVTNHKYDRANGAFDHELSPTLCYEFNFSK